MSKIAQIAPTHMAFTNGSIRMFWHSSQAYPLQGLIATSNFSIFPFNSVVKNSICAVSSVAGLGEAVEFGVLVICGVYKFPLVGFNFEDSQSQSIRYVIELLSPCNPQSDRAN